jgi:hypothetical protein
MCLLLIPFFHINVFCVPTGVAIRCREAKQLRGGKSGRTGWFVGKTMREAILDCHWHSAVVGMFDIGVFYM